MLNPRNQGWTFLAFALLLAFGCGKQAAKEKKDLVNVFVGTGGHGHTYPGATLPFGAVQLSPDTRLEGWDGCSGYHYSDSIIYGFSHTHLSGTGVSDYGDILLMPMTAPRTENGAKEGPENGYSSRFKKADEKAGPGWYQVKLEEGDIEVKLNSTLHCGLHSYTFKDEMGYLIIDLRHRDPVIASSLRIIDNQHIEGYRFSNAWARDQRIFFHAEFSQPFIIEQLAGETKSPQFAEGKSVFALLKFDFSKEKELKVKLGLSGVSSQGAQANLQAEMPDWDFAHWQSQSDSIWNQQLGKIEVKGGSLEQQRIFYSALYHCFIAPNTFSDVDGSYRGMDGQRHQAGSPQYTIFSLWDTYRAEHPLFTLVEQKRSLDFIKSFLRMYEEGGRLPVWELAGNETDCMIGYHSVSVISDAYAKGIRDFDQKLALKAMRASAEADRFGLGHYQRQGHIGAGDEAESVSKTLEYAYDDWCIAVFAKAIGADSVAATYFRRAQYYKNLFDPKTGFFRAKMNGSWQEPFDPREVNFNFTEANAWQYSLAVQQDIHGLIALMGGKEKFEKHLDQLFSAETATTGREQADITGLIGQYAHGNEPSHHMAWLYFYTDSPQKGQERIRQILAEMYHDAPDGLSGNEDCGQMSAWYAMSAIGLYAPSPGSPNYLISAPIFPEVNIHLENGKTFSIKAEGTDKGKGYIRSVKWKGQPYDKRYLSHQEIMEGGLLEFEMDAQPHADWAKGAAALPPAQIEGPVIAAVPFFEAPKETFNSSMEIGMASVQPEASIHFTLDGSLPNASSPKFSQPIKIEGNSHIRAVAILPDGSFSPAAEAFYYKVDSTKKLSLQSHYENQYAAGGDNALIDGLRGGSNFRTGRWQGYQEDMELSIDFGRLFQMRRVKVGFLQDIGSWIWMPKQVDFSFSYDGENWATFSESHSVKSDDYQSQVLDIVHEFPKPTSFRYMKIKAHNFGKCPPWHLGAGGLAWIFADEIVFE